MDASVRRAVFLSYARQDSDEARRIADGLMREGIEVWIDQSELRGGDDWDKRIRTQIKECTLFVPIVSANTQARPEGYFRLEWNLADRRTQLMGRTRAFLLPISVDATTDADADVPDSFLAAQWTILPRGEVTPAFVARTKELLGAKAPIPVVAPVGGSGGPHPAGRPAHRPQMRSWHLLAMLGIIVTALTASWLQFWRREAHAVTDGAAAVAPQQFPTHPELRQAWDLVHGLNATAEDFALAEDIIKVVVGRRPTDPEATIVYAWHGAISMQRISDPSDERYAITARYAERAMQLAPDNAWAVAGMAKYLLARRADLPRAKQLARRAITLRPAEPRLHQVLIAVLLHTDAKAALETAQQAAALFPDDAVTHYFLGQCYRGVDRPDEAEAELDRALALAPMAFAMIEKIQGAFVRGDIRAMRKWLNEIPQSFRLNARVVFWSYVYAYVSFQPEYGLRRLHAFPGAWIRDTYHSGPKSFLIGELLELQGMPDLARVQYDAALGAVNQGLVANPADLALRSNQMWILFRLGRTEEARTAADLFAKGAQLHQNWALWFSQLRARLLLGPRESVLELMQRVATSEANRTALRSIIWMDPRMEKWRTDPEINALFLAPAGTQDPAARRGKEL